MAVMTKCVNLLRCGVVVGSVAFALSTCLALSEEGWVLTFHIYANPHLASARMRAIGVALELVLTTKTFRVIVAILTIELLAMLPLNRLLTRNLHSFFG